MKTTRTETIATKGTMIQTALTNEQLATLESFGVNARMLNEFIEIKELKNEVTKRYDALNKIIKNAMAEIGEDSIIFDGHSVSINTTEKTILDSAKVKADLGELLPQYQKTSVSKVVNVKSV